MTLLDEKLFWILEKVHGPNLKNPENAPEDFKLSSKHIQEMRRQVKVMLQKGIFPMDIDFIFLKDGGAVLIDPELFSFDSLIKSYTDENIERLTSGILDMLVKRWSQRGLVLDE